MRIHVLLFAVMCFSLSLSAQKAEEIVKNAEKLISDGMPKDAAALLKKEISNISCAQDAALYVKANILYISALSQYEEDVIPMSIKHLNEVMPKCTDPAVQVFHSYLGELYMQFSYNQSFDGKNLDASGDDIMTWSMQQVRRKALEHFRASLQNPQKLFQTPAADYNVILSKNGDDVDETCRPTLYDLIAHRFFDNCPEKPSIAEYPALTKPLPEFLQINVADDAASYKIFAIKTYQELLRLHQKDADPTALIQGDLDRVDFFSNNNLADFSAYDYLLKTYDNHPAVALAAFEKAQKLNAQGYSDWNNLLYQKNANTAGRQCRVEAVELCRTYSKKFPNSKGGKNCNTLRQEMERQELVFLNTEPVVVPEKPSLANVQFRNLHRLTCIIYQIPSAKTDIFSTGNKEKELKQFISGARPVKQWEIEIPDPQDYLTHSTEFEIPALDKSGTYLLLITPEPVFSVEKSLFVTQVFQVSSLFPIYTQTTGKKASFMVTNRTTGLPLKGVSIQIFSQNNKTLLETLTTDDNGVAYLSKDHNNSLTAIFSLKGDSLSVRNGIWNSKQSLGERKNQLRVSLFTDRAVYRPGQTVYFKGILTEISENSVVTVSKKEVELSIRDVNYQEILKQKLTSNDFGGFDGSFTIPSNVLTGNMTLQTPYGTAYFSVEEYKRPRFEVTFDKIKEAYQLNQEVKITGKAVMLNGLPLENAKVDYQISRYAFRPFRYYFPYQPKEQFLITGTTVTKADGTFEITFKTVAEQEDKNGRFYYVFNVMADVTDITGEMQNGSTNISAGFNSVKIGINVPEIVTGKENDELKLTFKNYDDENVPVSATLVIEELKQPNTPQIQRSWQIPDIKIISKEDFSKKFPQYAYDSDSLPVSKKVYSYNIVNKESEILKLNDKLSQSGKYRITISMTDKAGRKVEETKEFTFLKENEKAFPVIENAVFQLDKTEANIGEKVQVLMASGAKDAKVFYTLLDAGGIKKQQWMEIGKKVSVIEIPVDSTMIAGFRVNMQLVRDNRIYEESVRVSVIDPSKELKIEVTGIRDKTMPGAKERWQMKITGNDGNPADAALFATMYDASLDKFAALSWSFTAKPTYKQASFSSNALTRYSMYSNNRYNDLWVGGQYLGTSFPSFDWFGYNFYTSGYRNGRMLYKNMAVAESMAAPTSAKGEMQDQALTVAEVSTGSEEVVMDEEITDRGVSEKSPENVRQNFAETVFFYPDLRTDKEGNIILEFTMPDALTRWNMQAIGYTNNLKIGNFNKTIITESNFMVMPNLPRYLRVGDTCVFTTRIANRTDKPLSGTAKIVVENMATGASLQENIVDKTEIPFNVNGGESITVSWKYRQPDNAEALKIRMTATSGSFTDGEEHVIPVLPSEIILQETIAMEMTKAGTHTYTFKNFDSNPQRLTVEMSTSPVWFAIQSLPTLAEYPYESNDQIFNRYYSAALGSYILNSMPQIKRVFEQWRTLQPDALLSNLEKNQELKALLLAETPWVMEAQNETARKQRLSTLFDVNNLTYSLKQTVSKLQQRQRPDGGFPWYPDMKSSEYITRYIVTGIGKLNKLGIVNQDLNFIADQAIQYLDGEWMKNYEKNSVKGVYTASSYDVAYFYARSFFLDKKFDDKQSKAIAAVLKDCVQKQKDFDFNTRAMLALTLQRRSQPTDAQTIAKSLDNYSIGDAATGKYWRTQQGNGNSSDIALSALMVEVYHEILNDKTASNEVLTWLLRNKRTNDWKTPVATADAVYALVSASPTSLEPAQVSMKVGGETVAPEKQESGTGYFQVVYGKGEMKPEMKTITVTSEQDKQVWGGAYLQYRSSLDKVKGDKDAPLSVDREIFKRTGNQWVKISEKAPLQVGDKISIRMTIKANRDFDFVHLRDMRAAAFEPVEQTSGYSWNNQLGYYRSVRDAVVDLFFDHIPRGTWAIDYELFVTQHGNFSNGYSSIQCFYAPEFSGVSDGMKVEVK